MSDDKGRTSSEAEAAFAAQQQEVDGDDKSHQHAARSHSLTNATTNTTELECIAEEDNNNSGGSGDGEGASGGGGGEGDEKQQASNESGGKDESGKCSAKGKSRRAHMVKKAIRYFEDKSKRSVSEDNLFTRRKNLAVHLGLDEKVSKKEIQKINTFSLPVPASVSLDIPDPTPPPIVVVEPEIEEKSVKDLVNFLGMKDGLTASIASRGSLCYSVNEEARKLSSGSVAGGGGGGVPPTAPSPSPAGSVATTATTISSASDVSTATLITKLRQNSLDNPPCSGNASSNRL